MSRILFIKAIRSIWRSKGAYASCIALIAIGVFSYVALYGAAQALSTGAETFYRSNRMADVFAELKGIPASDISSLEQIDGVDEVQLRLTYDARMVQNKTDKTIWLRLISYDDKYQGIPINAPDINGSPLSKNNDILVSRNFLTTHELELGSKITLIVQGKEIPFQICGSANAPDYIYTIKDATTIFPDNESFGIAYVKSDYLQEILGTKNTFNSVNFTLKNGVPFVSVEQSIKDSLSTYGLKYLVERKDQASFNMLNSEIEQNITMATSLPVLFSGMAAIVLFLMLKRLIEQERMQIGTLKAFGYSNFSILFHFLLYGWFTSIVGSSLGILLGSLSMQSLVDMYTQFFTLPIIPTQIPLNIALRGFIMAFIFGTLGAFFGAYGVLNLNPAEAMRPPSPPVFKKDIVKSLPFLIKILTSRGNMSLRNMLRSKVRSLFIIIGVMFSYGSITVTLPVMDLMTNIIKTKYTIVQAYDIKLFFKNPVDSQLAIEDGFKMNGVTMAETIREIPAEVRHNNRKETYVIMGLDPNSVLYRLYDDKTKSIIPLPKSGTLITKFVADGLGVKVGDILTVKTAYNQEEGEEILLPISGIINQNMSSVCYISSNILNKMLDLPDQADSLLLKTTNSTYIKDNLEEMKNIAEIEEPGSTAENFSSLMSSYSGTTWIFFFLGLAIAFAIIYNASVISMSEKKREYATLRVLGLSIKEICEIHSFEYWSLCTLGCLIGIPFSSLLLRALNEMIKAQLDTLQMPTNLSLFGIAMGFMGCLSAVLLSNYWAKKEIRQLDMVDVLKERE